MSGRLYVTTNQICIAVELFNWALQKSLWFSAVYYRIWLEGYQIICVRFFLLAKDKKAFKIKLVNICPRSPRALTKRRYVYIPVDTGRKLNVHKTFRKRLGRLMYVQFTSFVYGGGIQ